MTHHYEPLAHADSEMRLAILDPGAYNDEIWISFQIRELTNDTIGYEALSYAWGSAEDPSLARIHDGGSCAITRNLDDALRHLRFHDEARVMWIDALCINQGDTTEKNRQVEVMGDIFFSATRVLMWLGLEADESGAAFELLEKLSQEIEVDVYTLQMQPSSQCTSTDWANTTRLLPFVAGELTPVHALYERAYFRRAWIRQEIVLAKQATVYCGKQRMDWQDFRRATLCLSQKSWDEDTAIEKGTWRAFQDSLHGMSDICCMLQYCFHIATIRYSPRAAECQDNRDRIYSLLSLIGWQDRLLEITPDYDVSAEHLYRDVAKRCLELRQALTFLESCHPASNILELPSWVPDWSTRHPITGSQPENAWSACGWISAQACIEENTLFARGISIARVQTIQHFNIQNEPEFHLTTLRIIRQMRPSHWNADPESLNDQAILRDWCFALAGGLLDSGLPLPKLMDILTLLWSSDTDWDQLQKLHPGISPLFQFVGQCYHVLVNRCFFSATNGHSGLGLYNMQVGDLVCVILGCDHPVVLRSVDEGESTPQWQVVGSAIVPGIMSGEAIYSGKLPAKYQRANPVVHGRQYRGTRNNIREGYESALYDAVNNVIVNNPVVVLEDAGIKVDHYQNSAFQVHVLPKTLRDASVHLEMFAIV